MTKNAAGFRLSTGHNREAPVPQPGPFHVCRPAAFPQYTAPYIFLDLRVERYCGNALFMAANVAKLPELLRR